MKKYKTQGYKNLIIIRLREVRTALFYGDSRAVLITRSSSGEYPPSPSSPWDLFPVTLINSASCFLCTIEQNKTVITGKSVKILWKRFEKWHILVWHCSGFWGSWVIEWVTAPSVMSDSNPNIKELHTAQSVSKKIKYSPTLHTCYKCKALRGWRATLCLGNVA